VIRHAADSAGLRRGARTRRPERLFVRTFDGAPVNPHGPPMAEEEIAAAEAATPGGAAPVPG
jgi:hypothetical protein